MTVLLLALVVVEAIQTFHPPREHWSYVVVAPDDVKLTSLLNTMGAQGWEVVSARRATRRYGLVSYELILKHRGKLSAAEEKLVRGLDAIWPGPRD